MTDISLIISSTDVFVLIDLIVNLEGQVGELEEKLSQATDKNTLLVEENIRLQARIGEVEHQDFPTLRL